MDIHFVFGTEHCMSNIEDKKKKKEKKKDVIFKSNHLGGKATSYQNLACFVCYFKIINIIFKSDICILK